MRAPDPSSLVDGRFARGELLGAGGSATVHAAVDVESGAAVALKVLHAHLSARPAARAAFLAEAARAMRLQHPNIVRVLAAGTDETHGSWIALERAPGTTLARLVAERGPLPPAEASSVVGAVLRGLSAAHALGLAHRDVSPSNVMVDPARDRDSVKLLDFGSADASGTTALATDELLSARATGREGVIGNVNYLSPEQARGEPVDARGDVYQVGGLLYFALTGGPPFPCDSVGETVRAHLEWPPPVPSEVNPHVPRRLDRVVARAMMKDPDDRFPTATAMRRALAAATAGEPGSAPIVIRSPARSASAVAAARAHAAADAAESIRPRQAAPEDAPASAPAPRRGGILARTGLSAAAAALVAVAVALLVSRSPSVSLAEVEPPPSPSVSASVAAPAPSVAATVPPAAVFAAVPDLAGYSTAEAVDALRAAGFEAAPITPVHGPRPRDTVVASDPAAGSRLAVGEQVELMVASGWNAVPDVTGMTRAAAVAALQSAGFAPAFAATDASRSPVAGTDPAGGTIHLVGSSVTILPAAFPEPTTTPRPVDPSPNPSPVPTPTISPTPAP
ncbi:PASTA domain-containing protein [Microbacterium sp. NPDC057407]|uniref:protein kinase domain-containing protein n=1 Tax=Microbacterium sp. NPDC057407 TaxID=3346120 RepID=UPI00366B58A5